MRKRPLLLCACVFLAGLAYYRYHRPEITILLVIWIGYEWYCGVKSKRKKLAAGRSIILLSAFILGSIHMASEMAFRNAYLPKLYDGDTVTVWGEIIKIETTNMGSSRFILSDCYISLEEGNIPCNDILVYPSSNQYQVGEIHKITGELNIFEKARNEGGFDSQNYYHSQKIDFCVHQEGGGVVKKSFNWLSSMLFALRERMEMVYESCVSARTAGFLSGMVLGERSGVEEDLKQLFTNGGIAHILAISGLHISTIGRGLYRFIRKRGVGFKLAGIAAGLVLLMYCYMVGSGMSAVRAAGMLLLFFLAQTFGRSYDMLNALGGMCICLLWENPFLLEYSGFWFSVLALMGVGFVGKVFSMLREKRKGFLMSMGISLTTLPVVACCYYEIPLYSPIVNFLLLPILTPMFILALIGGLTGVFVPWVAEILLQPCEWCLMLYEWVCTMIEKLPFAIAIVGNPSLGVIVIYYMVLAVGTYMLKRMIAKKLSLEKKADNIKKHEMNIRRKEYVLIAAITVICLSLIIYPKPQKEEITFLDVGQGDGIYICTGDGSSYFIDGGSINQRNLGKYCILPFFKSNDIEKIDYWFISHADTDHISGVLEVIESGYTVHILVVPEAAPEDENMMKLLGAAKERGVEVIYMQAGDCLRTEYTTLTCLYPEADENPALSEDRNETSLVLEYVSESFGEEELFRAIFTGDISSEVEKVLLQRGKLHDVWLYKAAHHGSKYSNSSEMLQILSPEIVVISCGENNVYGHPAVEAVERMREVGAELLYTMYGGQITIQENDTKKGLAIEPYLLLQ